MGDICNSHDQDGPDGKRLPFALPGVARVALALALALFVPTSAALATEPLPAVRTDPAPTVPAHPIVSMALAEGAPSGQPGTPSVPSPSELPPLTRAAERLKIERMSPVRWMSRYGEVSVSQTE